MSGRGRLSRWSVRVGAVTVALFGLQLASAAPASADIPNPIGIVTDPLSGLLGGAAGWAFDKVAEGIANWVLGAVGFFVNGVLDFLRSSAPSRRRGDLVLRQQLALRHGPQHRRGSARRLRVPRSAPGSPARRRDGNVAARGGQPARRRRGDGGHDCRRRSPPRPHRRAVQRRAVEQRPAGPPLPLGLRRRPSRRSPVGSRPS